MQTLTGACHCGKNTFKITGDPEFQFICHCTNCRVLNSGGHLCGIIFPAANLTEAAETSSYSYEGGSGKPIIMHFCPTCGTSLYAYPTAFAGKVAIRANTLPNANFKAQQILFPESAFVWDKSVNHEK